MPTRAPAKQAAPAEVLSQLNQGYNGYTDPTLTNPKMWTAATNVFTGAFGYLQRARFANVLFTDTLATTPSLKFYAIPATGAYLLYDQNHSGNGKMQVADLSNYTSQNRFNPYFAPGTASSPLLTGPWSREVLENIVYEMNGQVKQTGRSANALTIESFGLDAPDTSPQVVISAGASQNITGISRSNGVVSATIAGSLTVPGGPGVGMINVKGVTDTSFNGTFIPTVVGLTMTWNQLGQNATSTGGTIDVSITKAIGRSYSYAWENANKAHVGAPSPTTQYIQYSTQNGQIQLVEVGTLNASTSSQSVVGSGTQFTSAWVGRNLWIAGIGGNTGTRIVSVTDATHLTVAGNLSISGGSVFQVYDQSATEIRLYETADGQATYFRVQRNIFSPTGTTLAIAGLLFYDSGNSEPPNFPFTTEVAQVNNVPPPIGAFLNEYQGRLCVFGVSGSPQSFFYSNQESTQVGLVQESFAPLNQVTLPIANGQINGMLEFPGSMIIWSDKQDMFRLTGLLTDNTVTGVAAGTAASQQGAQIARLPYALGCASPFACEITPLGGIWLTSNSEVWLFTDRYAPRNIGRPVQNILNSILPANLSLARMKYYHNNTRNWLALSVAANQASTNNTVLILDLDLLASNGSPSYFTFDMATNSPAWYVYQPGTFSSGAFTAHSDALEVVYEPGGIVRLISSDGVDGLLQDIDYQSGQGTELAIPNGSVTLHAWGNDSPFVIKRPSWIRFNTNRDPSILSNETSVGISSISRSGGVVTVTTSSAHGLGTQAVVFIVGVTNSTYNGSFQVVSVPSNTTLTYNQIGPNSSSSGGLVQSGWNFQVLGIEDDFFTFTSPLALQLIPGDNDSSTLCGNPDFVGGLAFRHSPELYRIGGVNFVAGRRLQFQVNFPAGIGTNYQLRQIQLGFGVEPPN